jgi:glyoxylate carboligase
MKQFNVHYILSFACQRIIEAETHQEAVDKVRETFPIGEGAVRVVGPVDIDIADCIEVKQ